LTPSDYTRGLEEGGKSPATMTTYRGAGTLAVTGRLASNGPLARGRVHAEAAAPWAAP